MRTRLLWRTTPDRSLAAGLARLLPLWGLLLTLAGTNYGALPRDLWTDEAFTASYMAHASLGALLDDVRKNEETPPLYFVALWGWSRGFGASEESLRGFSLLCGVLATLALSRIARRHLEPRAAFFALTVFALSPLLQFYLIEARGYTLTVLLATLCVAAYERLWRAPDSRMAQTAYLLSAVALFLTSYFGTALLAAQWLLWLGQLRAPATRGRRLRDWALLHLVACAGVAWWLPALTYQVRVAPAVTADWSQGWRDYVYLALGVVTGAAPPQPLFFVWLGGAATGVCLMLASALARKTGGAGLALRAAAAPGVLLLVLVLALRATAMRYLIILLPGAALALGAGLSALLARRSSLAWVCAACLLGSLLVLRSQVAPVAPLNPWAELSAEVARQSDPTGDVVLFHPPWDQRIFEYYYDGPALPLLGAHHYDDFYMVQGYELLRTWRTSEALPLLAPYRRVWVFYDQMFHRVPPLDLPYRELGRWRAGRLELILYAVAPGPASADRLVAPDP